MSFTEKALECFSVTVNFGEVELVSPGRPWVLIFAEEVRPFAEASPVLSFVLIDRGRGPDWTIEDNAVEWLQEHDRATEQNKAYRGIFACAVGSLYVALTRRDRQKYMN